MADLSALRRRAAWAVLSGVLDEDSLVEALWLQHASMRGDSVTDIIAFVDAVGSRHLLDAATRKRLYAAFFEALRQREDTLPMDPWPLMVAARPPVAAPEPLRRSPVVPVAPVMQPIAAPVPVAQAVPAPVPTRAEPPAAPPVPAPEPAPPEPPLPPHQVVFSTLVGSLVDGVRQYHPDELADVLSDCRARLDKARIPPALRAAAREALVTPTSHAWKLDGTQDQLIAMVHEVYVALCEALGPVDADHLLMLSVRQAERLPEARSCPPNRFL